MSETVNIYYDKMKNTIAIKFNKKPSASICEGLKQCGFKYNWNDVMWTSTAKLESKDFIKSTMIPYYNRENIKFFIKDKDNLHNKELIQPKKSVASSKKSNSNRIISDNSKHISSNKYVERKGDIEKKTLEKNKSNDINKITLLPNSTQAKVVKERNKQNEEYKIGVYVKHQMLGKGKVVNKNNRVIEVKFDNETILKFNLETCLDDNILEVLNLEKNYKHLDNHKLDELIKISNEMYYRKELGSKLLKINKIIIEKGYKEVKYYLRLAECYKQQEMIEEAIDIYYLVLDIDKGNRHAQDNIALYGKDIYYKYKDKTFDGVFRDVFSPPVEETIKWFEEETKKNNTKFLNSINK